MLAFVEAFASFADFDEDVFVFAVHPYLGFVAFEFVVEACFRRVVFEDVDDLPDFFVAHLGAFPRPVVSVVFFAAEFKVDVAFIVQVKFEGVVFPEKHFFEYSLLHHIFMMLRGIINWLLFVSSDGSEEARRVSYR